MFRDTRDDPARPWLQQYDVRLLMGFIGLGIVGAFLVLVHFSSLSAAKSTAHRAVQCMQEFDGQCIHALMPEEERKEYNMTAEQVDKVVKDILAPNFMATQEKISMVVKSPNVYGLSHINTKNIQRHRLRAETFIDLPFGRHSGKSGALLSQFFLTAAKNERPDRNDLDDEPRRQLIFILRHRKELEANGMRGLVPLNGVPLQTWDQLIEQLSRGTDMPSVE